MSGRLRGLQPSAEWLGDGGGRWSNQPRDPPGPSYDWLTPCEGPAAAAEREGPLRRLRPQRPELQGLPSTGWLPQGSSGIVRSQSSSAVGTKGRSKLPGQKSFGKRPDPGIWPAGAPGPAWQPQTEEQRQWRAIAGSAVRAAAQVRMGGRSRSGRGASKPRRQVEETPGIEAWDSVSQAPSQSAPGSPRSERTVTDYGYEAMSAQTIESSVAGEHKQLDRVIREHMSRNRVGWHDWHGGRLLG
eukprot:gb/GFBE01029698.1/.p1 GENE.gb/GFBE01029698.1/~~gb/GFBE01029698.1/.p1  ORF type:complete len:243 (+),score=17.57 gb/GFBE01029698.1/:1-729(+)